jgi:hypothetical protein
VKRCASVLALLLFICFMTICVHNVKAEAAVEPNFWETLTPMQQARSNLGVAVVNEKIYAIGGTTSGGLFPASSDDVGTNEMYDPATDTWTQKTPMPTPRSKFAIAVYQNKIYCIGGQVGTKKGKYDIGNGRFIEMGYVFINSAVNEVYDPATDTWETKASAPEEGMFMQAAVLDNRIYMIDGPITEVYNPENDSWTTKASAPIPVEDLGPNGSNDYVLISLNDKLYVVGEFSDQILEYDPLTDCWSQGATLPIPGDDYWNVEGGATIGTMAPKRLHLLFALRGIPETGSKAYNPDNDDWITCKPLPTTNRSNFCVAVVEDKLYAIGGDTSDGLGHYNSSALNERYTPIGYIPEFPSWIILPLVLVGSLTIVLFKKKVWRQFS